MSEITGKTSLYAILADPVYHVKTPQGINRFFERQERDAVMVPLHVKSDQLSVASHALRALHNFKGCVVTVPHKTAMLGLCDEVTESARQCGAVNVVHRTADGRLVGSMLDGFGFVAGLTSENIEPAGMDVHLSGAGGAASAIAFALAARGVRSLTIANRSLDKAAQLVTRVSEAYPQVRVQTGTRDASGHHMVVNGTSLGMRLEDDLPLDVASLQADQIVAEIIMEPALTPLLVAASARGCLVHPGAPMLASQIALMAAFMDDPEKMENTYQ